MRRKWGLVLVVVLSLKQPFFASLYAQLQLVTAEEYILQTRVARLKRYFKAVTTSVHALAVASMPSATTAAPPADTPSTI